MRNFISVIRSFSAIRGLRLTGRAASRRGKRGGMMAEPLRREDQLTTADLANRRGVGSLQSDEFVEDVNRPKPVSSQTFDAGELAGRREPASLPKDEFVEDVNSPRMGGAQTVRAYDLTGGLEVDRLEESEVVEDDLNGPVPVSSAASGARETRASSTFEAERKEGVGATRAALFAETDVNDLRARWNSVQV